MTEEEIPPGTDLINAIRAEKSPYHQWAGEALDNALDAQASIVHLDMTKDTLTCKDNGHGVTKDNDRAMVKISQHGEIAGTKLGRFGVGIKYKAIQHGKTFHIHSVSKDGRLRRSVDWEGMLATGKWFYGSAIRTPVNPGTATGTAVIIKDLITRAPTKADIERTRAELQRRYYPALEDGKTITLNGEPVVPIVRPKLEYEVEVTLQFPGGRSAHVHAGMLSDPHTSKLRQVDICHAYRVIKPESGFGCNGYGGIRSMYGKLTLIGRAWKLTKFKDDLAEDPYEDALQEAVEKILKPILERCESASMFLKTRNLEQLLNDMLPENQRMTRPLQKQRLNRKGKKPGDKRIKVLDESAPSPSGPTRKRKNPPALLIEFADHLHETHGFGRAIIEKTSSRIQLANDNPYISQLKNLRDQETAKIGLFAIAMLLYEGDLQTQAPRLLGYEPIGLRAWKLKAENSTPQAEAAE